MIPESPCFLRWLQILQESLSFPYDVSDLELSKVAPVFLIKGGEHM